MSDHISVETVIIDYTWTHETRPEITLDQSQKHAYVKLGDGPDCSSFELVAVNSEDLIDKLNGLSQMFAKAADVLKGAGNNDAD